MSASTFRSTSPVDDAAVAAAGILTDHWRAGTRIAALPGAVRPQTREEGYKVQALFERESRHPLFGWKIAATSEAGQRHIAVSGPLAGRLLRERVIRPGGTVALGTNQMRVAEMEFAFRMGARLAAREAPYTVEEVLDAIETLHPSIEIPDSRFENFEQAGEAQLVADNACAHFFVCGDATDFGWRDVDLSAHIVVGQINDGPEKIGIGSNVLGDPRLAMCWIANELSMLGIGLEPGQVVTTGACVPPMAIAAEIGRAHV